MSNLHVMKCYRQGKESALTDIIVIILDIKAKVQEATNGLRGSVNTQASNILDVSRAQLKHSIEPRPTMCESCTFQAYFFSNRRPRPY